MISKHLLNVNTFFKLRSLLKSFPFDADSIKHTQFKLIKKLLIHSYDHFEFYKDRFDKVGFSPFKFESIDEIQKIPVLEKSEYRDFVSNELKKDPSAYKKYYKDGTSGTTGEPMSIYRSWNERAYMLAKYLRTLFANGYSYRDITFCLPSPHRITKSDSIIQKLGFLRRSAIAYTEPVGEMVDGYIRSNADLLYANKSQLVQMSEYILNEKIEINKPGLINCSGEVLDNKSRDLIESVFGQNRLFEVYGAVEFNNLAFQIADEKYFHFNHDTDLIELEDDQGDINSEKGRCIVTDFNIYSFPLIRYKLNDWIEMKEMDGLGVITKIIGREDDWVLLEEGKRISFHPFYEIMEKRPMVRQFRFVQESYKLINAYIVLEKGIIKKDFERELLFDLKEEISNNIIYNINFVDNISTDPSGKQRILISKIS